jgi:Rps23 Pro-64 3,4-dihydroxylase Tpa1-like proline 4-hydroxylase
MAMMWRLSPAWQDEARLATAWRAAEPFPHLVFDGVVADDDLAALLEILEDEPVDRYEGDLFAFEASAPVPATEAMAQLRDSFASVLAPPLARITGKAVRRADMRAYAYRVGHYLLPHADHQDGLGRALAFAYYLPSPEPPEGGELELFRCQLEDGALISTVPDRRIEPRGNRLVIFDVSDVSLHQVCEVLSGLRISLAGWFYS